MDIQIRRDPSDPAAARSRNAWIAVLGLAGLVATGSALKRLAPREGYQAGRTLFELERPLQGFETPAHHRTAARPRVYGNNAAGEPKALTAGRRAEPAAAYRDAPAGHLKGDVAHAGRMRPGGPFGPGAGAGRKTPERNASAQAIGRSLAGRAGWRSLGGRIARFAGRSGSGALMPASHLSALRSPGQLSGLPGGGPSATAFAPGSTEGAASGQASPAVSFIGLEAGSAQPLAGTGVAFQGGTAAQTVPAAPRDRESGTSGGSGALAGPSGDLPPTSDSSGGSDSGAQGFGGDGGGSSAGSGSSGLSQLSEPDAEFGSSDGDSGDWTPTHTGDPNAETSTSGGATAEESDARSGPDTASSGSSDSGARVPEVRPCVGEDCSFQLFPDISFWQHPADDNWNPLCDKGIDWDALAQASRGIVSTKVMQGAGDEDLDPCFKTHLAEAGKRGMIVIGYAFGTDESGVEQAKAMLRAMPPAPGRIYVLDWEPARDGELMTLQQAKDFATHMKQETGRYPILYLNTSGFDQLLRGDLGDPGVLAECPRWAARYFCYGSGSNPCEGPQNPPSVFDVVDRAPADAVLWQFTDGGDGPLPHAFDGIGPSDINILLISYEELRSMAGLGTELAARPAR